MPNFKKTDDITTIDNGDMNGWAAGPNGSLFTVKNVADQWLFHGPETAITLQGTVLSKQMEGLTPGQAYVVAFHCRKNNDKPQTPPPGISINDQTIIQNQRITSQDWSALFGTFTATSQSAALTLTSRVLHGDDSILTSTSNMDIDNLRSGEPYIDETPFTEKNWNEWQQGPAAHNQATLVEEGKDNFCINFPTASGNHAGVILEKTIHHLYPLAQYTFSLRIRRTNTKHTHPKISLHVNGTNISGIVNITETHWINLSGTFTADNFVHVLTVENHESSGMGNDLRIDDITVKELF